MSGSRREQLKRLIGEAEELMRRARLESRDIVADAERRARELVSAAEDLHRTAAAEARELRAAAEVHEADRRALEARIRELEARLRDSGGARHAEAPRAEGRDGAREPDSPTLGPAGGPSVPVTERRAIGRTGGEDLESDEATAIRRFRRRA